jgi:uncharacterized lipoprotein YmbA
MNRRRVLSLVAFGAMGLALSGCGAAGPPPTTYVLGTPAPAANTAEPLSGRPVIQVQRVLMPDYLDVSDLLIRRSANVMQPSQTGKWGERLSVGFRRALADDLGRDLSGFTVTSQQLTDRPSGQVLVDVDAFEPRPDGQVILSARWRLTDGNGARQLAGQNVSLTEQATTAGDAAVVAAMSHVIERLAQQVAASVQRNVPHAAGSRNR